MAKKYGISRNPWEWMEALYSDLHISRNLQKRAREAMRWRTPELGKQVEQKVYQTRKVYQTPVTTTPQTDKVIPKTPHYIAAYQHLMKGELGTYNGKTYFKYKGNWIPSRVSNPNPWQRHLDILAWEQSQVAWRRAGYKCYADYSEAVFFNHVNNVIFKALRSGGYNATLSRWDFCTPEERVILGGRYRNKDMMKREPIADWVNSYWKYLRPRVQALFVECKVNALLGSASREAVAIKKLTERDVGVITNYWGAFSKKGQRTIQHGFEKVNLESAAQNVYFQRIGKQMPVRPETISSRPVNITPTPPVIHPPSSSVIRKLK